MTDTVTVRLVGGPPDWDGKTVTYPADVLTDDPGAYLISAHPPERDPETQDIAPRAVYEPEPGGDPTRWEFQGWFPNDYSTTAPDLGFARLVRCRDSTDSTYRVAIVDRRDALIETHTVVVGADDTSWGASRPVADAALAAAGWERIGPWRWSAEDLDDTAPVRRQS